MAAPTKILDLKETRHTFRVCLYCEVSQSEKSLFICSGCKSARYCSADCQKKDWKNHKSGCKTAQAKQQERATNTEFQNNPLYCFGDHNAPDSFKALRSWCHHYQPILAEACTNAYDPQRRPSGSKDHVFSVTARLTTKAESGIEQRPSKMFEVEDAELIAKADLLTLFSKEMHDTIIAADEKEKSEKDRLKDGVMFMIVRCRGHVNIMTFPWAKRDIAGLRDDRQWKASLKQKLNSGRK